MCKKNSMIPVNTRNITFVHEIIIEAYPKWNNKLIKIYHPQMIAKSIIVFILLFK